MDDATSVLDREIREQPAVLARMLEESWWSVLQAADQIRAFDPACVVIAARGTSDNAARYAKYLLAAHNGLPVALAVPSLFTLYHQPPRLHQALVIGISQSGQSPDVVSVVAEGRRQGAVTLALTNDPESPLASAAESCVRLRAGVEHAVAATKTYTSELLAIAMLSAALDRDRDRWGALQFLPDAVSDAIRGASDLTATASRLADLRHVLVVSRGFNYCTAFELALKIKETSYVLAEAISPADLMHGPVAAVDRNDPVIIVAPSGVAADGLAETARVLARRRARVIAISDRDDILRRADLGIRLPAGVPEWVSPMVAIAPGQLLAHALAVAKGVDPNAPRGLSKVTLTH